jgi:signal transduction histidine kinase
MKTEQRLHFNNEMADSLIQQEELRLFYYRVIHDIKAPIASMIGLVNITKTKIKDKESQDFFNEIEKYFRLLETEIFSSLKNGAFYGESTNAVPVDFSEIIEEIHNLLSHSRSMNNIYFHKTIKQSRNFNINRQFLFSILQNIIDNSIKHGRNSDNVGMNIIIKIKQLEESVLIEIEDDGNGISENTKKKLFSDLNSMNDLLFKGNGLGLFIIKKTVEKLKGTLSIDQKNNRGTKFTIQIPEA